MQTQKIVNLALLVVCTISFMLFLRVMDFALDLGRLAAFEDWPVGPQHLFSLVIAGGLGLGVRLWGRGNQFLNEVVLELSKVSWPLGKENPRSINPTVIGHRRRRQEYYLILQGYYYGKTQILLG